MHRSQRKRCSGIMAVRWRRLKNETMGGGLEGASVPQDLAEAHICATVAAGLRMEPDVLARLGLMVKLLAGSSANSVDEHNRISQVWDHLGVPMALEGSPLPYVLKGPRALHFCYKNQTSSKRLGVRGWWVRIVR